MEEAIVSIKARKTLFTASIPSGFVSFARSARTWNETIDSAFSRSEAKSSAECVLKKESGSLPPGRDTTLTGISDARSSLADFTAAFEPAASSS